MERIQEEQQQQEPPHEQQEPPREPQEQVVDPAYQELMRQMAALRQQNADLQRLLRARGRSEERNENEDSVGANNPSGAGAAGRDPRNARMEEYRSEAMEGPGLPPWTATQQKSTAATKHEGCRR